MNISNWIDSLIRTPRRVAIPIMTHPGIELLGRRVLDAVTDGQTHYEAIAALDRRFPDAAASTVIMDLTVEAEAFGATIHFPDNEVPSVTGRLAPSAAEIEALAIPPLDTARVPEYLKACRLSAAGLSKPVFGGCIGPFSLAGRLYGMSEIMIAIYTEPEAIRTLLGKCAAFVKAYCGAIKATGAAGVIMAEPAAGLLSDEDCQAWSSDYIRPIVEALQDDSFAIILHNCGNTGHCTRAMTSVGARGYHFGNRIDMAAALRDSPADALVMGNLDPVAVFRMATPAEVDKATSELLEVTADYPNFVLSSGCDTPPEVPFANIEAFYAALGRYNS
ncbi:MAG: uroporphyrinogen decarboxylase family protein [Rikenellaceae bacterium]|nr:uroporphyrinogen decarboxylase family protein [Rikenellaceae bacterium]